MKRFSIFKRFTISFRRKLSQRTFAVRGNSYYYYQTKDNGLAIFRCLQSYYIGCRKPCIILVEFKRSSCSIILIYIYIYMQTYGARLSPFSCTHNCCNQYSSYFSYGKCFVRFVKKKCMTWVRSRLNGP